MKNLFKLLGLSETATEDDCITAVNKLKEPQQVIANKAVLEALGLKDGVNESEITGTIMAMKQSHGSINALTQQVNELTTELKKKEVEDITAMVNKAIDDGKVTPAQKEAMLEYAKKDAEGFKVFIAKAPVVVRKDKIASEEAAGKGAEVDDAVLQVCKMFGNTAEDIKKYCN